MGITPNTTAYPNRHIPERVYKYVQYLWQYRSIYKVLTSNELKGKFKYTFLGYLWHLLNPLSQIIIYLLIFTVIFGQGIPQYWVYVSSGMFTFSFMMSCVSGGCNSIISNSRLITKMAMAREVIVFSKVTVNLVTLAISYGLLIAIMIVTGTIITWNILYLPIIVTLLTLFCTGLTLALSAITVYIRDISNATSILMGCMMFAIPIMYLKNQRSTPMMELFWSINPFYYYIESIHNIIYWGISPDIVHMIVGIIVAPLSFAIGLFIFKKLEGGFAERL